MAIFESFLICGLCTSGIRVTYAYQVMRALLNMSLCYSESIIALSTLIMLHVIIVVHFNTIKRVKENCDLYNRSFNCSLLN